MTTTTAGRIIAQIKANQAATNRAGMGGPAMDAFNAEVLRQVANSPDPAGTIRAIYELLTCERGKTAAGGLQLVDACGSEAEGATQSQRLPVVR
ncbi:hypothetical protein ACFV06_16875 [Streptomyces sp. NPDC059618]|uniref:hypothetical protein n=1 Tax=Streptomyces sp. NPDC059618 TaxID=3346887 RepID=UPI0036CB0E1F